MIVSRVKLARMLYELGLAQSVSDAKRLIEGGAVRLDGERITYPEFTLLVTEGE